MLQTYANRPNGSFQRGTVLCSKCATPIALRRVTAVAEEFSVHCDKCGHRKIYSVRSIEMETVPERRRRAR